jgi:PemK-like, MazF-like toxin of type II toxin-antitoxin system
MPKDVLVGMAKTTISLDTTVRDRLAALARRHGRPLGEELAVLLHYAEGREFWDEVSVGCAHPDPSEEPAEEFPEYRALVCPLTTRRRGVPNHVAVAPDAANGLPSECFVMTEQIRAVDRRFLVHHVGVVAPGVLRRVLGVVRDRLLAAA